MNRMMPTDKITHTKSPKTGSLNQQFSHETQYLLSTSVNQRHWAIA